MHVTDPKKSSASDKVCCDWLHLLTNYSVLKVKSNNNLTLFRKVAVGFQNC